MRIFGGLILGAALLGAVALAPAAKADALVPGHYETRVVEQTDPGRWVDVERTVTSPGHWETFTREEVIVAGHFETQEQRVDLPPREIKTPQYVQVGNRVRTVFIKSWEPRGCTTREVQVWVPAQTRCVQDRRWVEGTTQTVCEKVFQPGCAHEVATQVWIPAHYDGCAPAPVCAPEPVCAPAPVCYPQPDCRRGDHIEAGFTVGGGRSRVHVSLGLFGR